LPPDLSPDSGIPVVLNMADLTFFEAALRILEEAGGGPLHYREITRRALERGLIKTSGLTPEATVGAILYSHIKQAEVRGEVPKVRSVGKGNFALLVRTHGQVEATVEQSNREALDRMLGRLHKMAPPGFEQLVGALLTQIGFEKVQITGRTGDGGLDVQAELTVGGITRVKTAIQVKRWKHNVPGKVIRELRGALTTDQRGLVVATSEFTKDALAEAAATGKVPISLIDGDRLVSLLADHQIGVKTRDLKYLVLDLEQFDAFEGTGPVSDERSLGLWPVPGGVRNYVESTVEMLKHIASASPTLEQMTGWVKKTFERAHSESTIKGYIGVLRTLGLTVFDGENLVVTSEGAECINGDSKTAIATQLQVRVAGVREILEALSVRPLSREEVHSLLLERLGTSWETMQQTDYRLQWMENTALVQKDGGMFTRGPGGSLYPHPSG